MDYVVLVIRKAADIYTYLVIIQVILSYFMSPFHPIRQTIDQIVEPLLSPIRRRIPAVGMFDFSPFILIVLVQIVVSIVTYLLLMIPL